MRSLIVLLALTTSVTAEPATRADKAQVLEWAKRFFADPYSLRSTEISDRAIVNGIPVLCVGFNAKNQMGGYIGLYRKPFEVRVEGLVPGERSSRVDTGTCYAPNITMRPFPELANIR